MIKSLLAERFCTNLLVDCRSGWDGVQSGTSDRTTLDATIFHILMLGDSQTQTMYQALAVSLTLNETSGVILRLVFSYFGKNFMDDRSVLSSHNNEMMYLAWLLALTTY